MSTANINPKLKEKIQNLPLLPTAITRLIALSPDDEHYFDKVLEIAQDDPSLSLRLIKFANTAQMLTIKPINSLKEAIVRIGIGEIFALVASIAVTKVFVPVTAEEKRIWEHSIEVATLARYLSEYSFKKLGIDPEQAYLTGLLHDVGLFLMFELDKSMLEQVNEYKWTTPQEHFEAEREVFRTRHDVLGAFICHQWKIPAGITWAVKMHHQYDLSKAPSAAKSMIALTRVIQLADFLSEYNHYNANGGIVLENLKKAIYENPVLNDWFEENGLNVDPKFLKGLNHSITIANKKFKNLGLG